MYTKKKEISFGIAVCSKKKDILTPTMELRIGRLPRRKRPCIYHVVSNEYCASIEILASFKDDESARVCIDFLEKFAEVLKIPVISR